MLCIPAHPNGVPNGISQEQENDSTFNLKIETISLTNPEEGLTYLQNCKGPKHLAVSFKIIEGSQNEVDKFMSKWMDIKTEMLQKENIRCSSTFNERDNGVDVCPTMVSFNVSADDKNGIEILKKNLVKAESQICAHGGSVVSINEGCIKIQIKAHDLYHLQQLESDIYSGQMVSRIANLLQKYGFLAHTKAALVLAVDMLQIQQIRKKLEKREQDSKNGNVSVFMIGYSDHLNMFLM